MVQTTDSNIIALDVGQRRVGIAMAGAAAKLAHPETTLQLDEDFFDNLNELIEKQNVSEIVVGLPRGLSGQETDQTRRTRAFIDELKKHTTLLISTQDEAGTSLKAKEELQARRAPYAKEEVDALAAVYILTDYLER